MMQLLGILAVGVAVVAAACAAAALLAGRMRGQPPVEGRFCPYCGGLLAYKRYRRAVRQQVSFETVLYCWSCTRRWPVHSEPEYAGRDGKEGPVGEVEGV